MTKKQSSENRRKLLKSIAAGGGAIVAGKSLPEKWAKPIVNSVLLPAHAQTSLCTSLVSSVPSSLSVQSIGISGDLDGIEILFDGCSSLTMVAGDDPGTSGDSIAFLDADTSQPIVFDVETGPAGNWTMLSNSFPSDPYISDVPEGSHSVRVTRVTGINAGTTYDILFDVSVPAISGGVEMTVTNLRAVVV